MIPLGLDASPSFFEESRGLYISTDSSWGTRAKPQGGHVVMRMNGALLWSSKILKIVADSTAHAETAEASRSVKSGTFVRMVCEGVGRPAVGPTSVLGDNKAMNDLVNKEGSSQLSRHFERATILVKYAVQRLLVACHHVGTKFCLADIFTKATDGDTFARMRSVIRNTAEDDVGHSVRRMLTTLMRVSPRRRA